MTVFKDDSLLQSAFWHHQSYWFEHMKDELEDIINIGISNIRQSMNDINSDEIISDRKSFLNSEDDISKWRSDTSQLEGIEVDKKYLLNESLGKPLVNFFNEV